MKKSTKFFLFTFLLLLWTTDYGLLTKCGIMGYAYAEIPHLINYQGRLTDKEGKPVTDGTYQVIFRIFDAATAGNLLWEETHASVLIQKGIFSILLGSVTNLNLAFDKPYYLEIETGDEVMSPRQQITSAGYAIRSERAEVAEKAERAQYLDMPAQNGQMLYYQDGWKTIPAPPEAKMYLTSQGTNLPPVWSKPSEEIVVYNELLPTRTFDSSGLWAEHLVASITLPEARYLEFEAYIDMIYYQWAIPQARVTIDGIVYTDEVSNPGSVWQTFNLRGATLQKMSAGAHTVKIEIRTTTYNLAGWRNAKLRLKAPI
jgi:hypothetical protein